MDFEVEQIEPLLLTGPEELMSQELMSPYVWWPKNGSLMLLVRAVPRQDAPDQVTGRIWLAEGLDDGLSFVADSQPLISPGPGSLDCRGCEDPTVVPTHDGSIVYYTGLNADGAGQMLYASGPDIRHLTKRGVALASSKTERNTKEATVERTRSGDWRLFYEFARNDRSRIGLAYGDDPRGPWNERNDPIRARPGRWDCWHLSTGPLLMTDRSKPVMFYNGSDESVEWSIGWVLLSADCAHELARSQEPLIAPKADAQGKRDIAFAASVIEETDRIWLYFSRNDRSLHRALIRRMR